MWNFGITDAYNWNRSWYFWINLFFVRWKDYRGS